MYVVLKAEERGGVLEITLYYTLSLEKVFAETVYFILESFFFT